MTKTPANARARALVVDDEPVARQALRELLAEVSWVEWVGEAADGLDAIAAMQRLRPDLVFLDVQMPGATGVEVLERAGVDAAVIFTTAHDEYAMIAFELGAIDYLRKPFGRERFQRALERARPLLVARAGATPAGGTTTGAGSAGATLAERVAFASTPPRTLTHVFVRDGGRVVPIQASDIIRCEAEGDYVAVYAAGRRHLVYVNLADLAARLDAERFVRIHRSHLINLDRVASFAPHDANRLEVRMHDGTRIIASRTGTQLLRARAR
jgi:two-component system LytT family response regulator